MLQNFEIGALLRGDSILALELHSGTGAPDSLIKGL
jgi:hypothetical protein